MGAASPFRSAPIEDSKDNIISFNARMRWCGLEDLVLYVSLLLLSTNNCRLGLLLVCARNVFGGLVANVFLNEWSPFVVL